MKLLCCFATPLFILSSSVFSYFLSFYNFFNHPFLLNKLLSKLYSSDSSQFNRWDGTPLILNSVRSVTRHLETTVGFLPEALAANGAWGLHILILSFLFFFINLSNHQYPLLFSSPERLRSWNFKVQTPRWCLSWGGHIFYLFMVFYSCFNLQSSLHFQPGLHK